MVNNIFFSLFFSEMCIKILGFGPKQYIRDRYNVFDAIISKDFFFHFILNITHSFIEHR